MNHSSILPRALTAGAALALSFAAAQAQGFSFTGDFSAGTGTLNVLADTTFNVTANSPVLLVCFDEAAALGTGSISFNRSYFTGVQYSINGADYSGSFTFVPRFGFSGAGMTANDAYMFSTAVSLASGDTVVLKQGSYTGAANASAQMAALEGVTVSQSYLTGSSDRISDIVTTAVPEPEEYAAVAAVGLVGFGLWRRTRRCA
jgi:hypothetical protein